MKPELKRKLEIALCSYLPHEVMTDNGKLIGIEVDNTYWIQSENNIGHDFSMGEFKLLLHPLSDLTKGENAYEEGFDEYRTHDLQGNKSECLRISNVWHSPTGLSYDRVQMLLKQHYDVFGLIEEGLAIDINTLKEKA